MKVSPGPASGPPARPYVIELIDDAGDRSRFEVIDALDYDGATHYLVQDAEDEARVLVLSEVAGGFESVTGERLDELLALFESELDEDS